MKQTIYTVLIIALFTGCMTLPPPNEEEKTIKKVEVNDSGELTTVIQKSVAGVPMQHKTLLNLGDRIDFKKGVPFELEVNGFDPQYYKLEYTFDDAAQTGSIEVKAIQQANIVELSSKCSRKIVTGREIPQVIYTGETDPKEQLIITPVYNKNCEFTGYEIRYGSVDRGCRGESSKILSQLKRCQGDNPQPTTKKRSKNSWREILFGE